MPRRTPLAAGCLAALSFVAWAQNEPPVVRKMLVLFDTLRQSSTEKRRFSIRLAEADINDYLRYSLRHTPRPGLDSLAIKVFPANYVSTFAVVDFDAVERWKPGTIPLLMRPVLSGKKSLWTDFRFKAQDGKLTFSVEKAYFQSIRLPAILVRKIIQIVAARQPEKYDTSRPVPLPHGLRQVWTREHLIEMQR
ncbi:MAG: hypothetical protein AAB225_04105 [Acidobacteriota bacterium]